MSVCTGAGAGAVCDDGHGGEHIAARRRLQTIIITAVSPTVFGRRPHGQTSGGHIQGSRLRQLGVRVVDGPDELERRRRRRPDRLPDTRTVVQPTDQKKYTVSMAVLLLKIVCKNAA